MTYSKWHNQAIALAALSQAVKLVDGLAKTGYLDQNSFEILVKSLFVTHPKTSEEVYVNVGNLRDGLEALIDTLNKGRQLDSPQVLSYSLGVLHLQAKLMKNTKMLNTISQGIETAKGQSAHFGPTHENTVSSLADCYSKTISTFTFRIQVSGDQQYLEQKRIANQIRVTLLTAIRAATLWRQNGGKRWSLLFQRKKLLHAAEDLLRKAKQIH